MIELVLIAMLITLGLGAVYFRQDIIKWFKSHWKKMAVIGTTGLILGGGALLTLEPPSLDTGWNNPTGDGAGYDEWTNPTNAYTQNDIRAQASSSGPGANEQTFSDFGFDEEVASAISIDGIELELDIYGAASGGDFTIKLSWNSGSSWTSTQQYENVGTSDTDTYYALGGSSDTWGHTWSTSELEDDNFLVYIVVQGGGVFGTTFYVDHVRCKVYYTINSNPTCTLDEIPASAGDSDVVPIEGTATDSDGGDYITNVKMRLLNNTDATWWRDSDDSWQGGKAQYFDAVPSDGTFNSASEDFEYNIETNHGEFVAGKSYSIYAQAFDNNGGKSNIDTDSWTHVGDNTIPYISNPIPENESTNWYSSPSMSIDIEDAEGDSMEIYWNWSETGTGSWENFGHYTSQTNGTKSETADFADTESTTYYWKVDVGDGTTWNSSDVFEFTTGTPAEINPWPANSSTDILTGITNVTFELTGGADEIRITGHNIDTGAQTISQTLTNKRAGRYNATVNTYFMFNNTIKWYINSSFDDAWYNGTYFTYTTFNGSGFLYLDNETNSSAEESDDYRLGVEAINGTYFILCNNTDHDIDLLCYNVQNQTLVHYETVQMDGSAAFTASEVKGLAAANYLHTIYFHDGVLGPKSTIQSVDVMTPFGGEFYTKLGKEQFGVAVIRDVAATANTSDPTSDWLHVSMNGDGVNGIRCWNISGEYSGFYEEGNTSVIQARVGKLDVIGQNIIGIDSSDYDLNLFTYDGTYTYRDTYVGTYNDIVQDGTYFYAVSDTSLDIFTVEDNEIVRLYSHEDSAETAYKIGDEVFLGTIDGYLGSFLFEGGDFLEQESEDMINNTKNVYRLNGEDMYVVAACEDGGLHLYGYELLRVAPPVIIVDIAGDPTADIVTRDGQLRYVNQSFNFQSFCNVTANITVPDYRTMGRYFKTTDDDILVASGNLSDGDTQYVHEQNHTIIACKYPCTYTGKYSQITAYLLGSGLAPPWVGYAIYDDNSGEPGNLLAYTSAGWPGSDVFTETQRDLGTLYYPPCHRVWHTQDIAYDANDDAINYIELTEGTDYWIVMATNDSLGYTTWGLTYSTDIYWLLCNELGDESQMKVAQWNITADCNFSNVTSPTWETAVGQNGESPNYGCIYAVANSTYNDITTVDITSATLEWYNDSSNDWNLTMTQMADGNWTYNVTGLDDNKWYSFDITARDELDDSVTYEHYRQIVEGNTERIEFMNNVPATQEADHLGYDKDLNTSADLYASPYVFYLENRTYGTDTWYGDDEHMEDALPHEQGVDGTADDTGGWVRGLPDDEIQARHCLKFAGGWWDENISIDGEVTLNRIYYHWWTGGGGLGAWDTMRVHFGQLDTLYDFGWLELTEEVGESWNYTELDTNASCRETYYPIPISENVKDPEILNLGRLRTGYIDVSNINDNTFDGSSIYNFFMGFDNDGFPPFDGDEGCLIYNNRTYLSYIIPNVPDNIFDGTDTTTDSDEDTLSDYFELNTSFTHPFLADTDGDGVNDATEYNGGSNPNNFWVTSNSVPTITNEGPTDGTVDVADPNPTLNATIGDVNHNEVDIYFYTNQSGAWTEIGSANMSTYTGWYGNPTTFNAIRNPTVFAEPSTKYWWSVNVTDGFTWTNSTFDFTTGAGPTVSSFSVDSEGSNNWDLDNNDVQIDFVVTDDDSDTLTAYFTYKFGSSPTAPTATNYDAKITGITSGVYTQNNVDLNWDAVEESDNHAYGNAAAGWVDTTDDPYIKMAVVDDSFTSAALEDTTLTGIDSVNPTFDSWAQDADTDSGGDGYAPNTNYEDDTTTQGDFSGCADATSGIATYEIKYDGGSYGTPSASEDDVTCTIVAGDNDIHYRIIDEAGNELTGDTGDNIFYGTTDPSSFKYNLTGQVFGYDSDDCMYINDATEITAGILYINNTYSPQQTWQIEIDSSNEGDWGSGGAWKIEYEAGWGVALASDTSEPYTSNSYENDGADEPTIDISIINNCGEVQELAVTTTIEPESPTSQPNDVTDDQSDIDSLGGRSLDTTTLVANVTCQIVHTDPNPDEYWDWNAEVWTTANNDNSWKQSDPNDGDYDENDEYWSLDTSTIDWGLGGVLSQQNFKINAKTFDEVYNYAIGTDTWTMPAIYSQSIDNDTLDYFTYPGSNTSAYTMNYRWINADTGVEYVAVWKEDGSYFKSYHDSFEEGSNWGDYANQDPYFGTNEWAYRGDPINENYTNTGIYQQNRYGDGNSINDQYQHDYGPSATSNTHDGSYIMYFKGNDGVSEVSSNFVMKDVIYLSIMDNITIDFWTYTYGPANDGYGSLKVQINTTSDWSSPVDLATICETRENTARDQDWNHHIVYVDQGTYSGMHKIRFLCALPGSSEGNDTCIDDLYINITGSTDSGWDSSNGYWRYFYGDDSGENFGINTYDAVAVKLNDGAGTKSLVIPGNVELDATDTRSIEMTNTTDNKGSWYVGYTGNNTMMSYINGTQLDTGLDELEYIGVFNKTRLEWDWWIVDFLETDFVVNKFDVVFAKIDDDTETWTIPSLSTT